MATGGGDGGATGAAPPADLDALMAEVEAAAARRRAEGGLPLDPSDVPLAATSPIDRLAEAWEVVGRRETLAGPKPVELARRAVVFAASPFTTDLVVQVNRFHLAAIDVARELEASLAAERAAREELEARVRVLEARLGGGAGDG